jgi:hypothetical protein
MPRHSEPIDTTEFTNVVADADAAYRIDASYATAMAARGATIQLKRQTWAIRLELRDAAAQAKEQCQRAEPFTCDVTTPCGTGLCRFAPPGLSVLTVKADVHPARHEVQARLDDRAPPGGTRWIAHDLQRGERGQAAPRHSGRHSQVENEGATEGKTQHAEGRGTAQEGCSRRVEGRCQRSWACLRGGP